MARRGVQWNIGIDACFHTKITHFEKYYEHISSSIRDKMTRIRRAWVWKWSSGTGMTFWQNDKYLIAFFSKCLSDIFSSWSFLFNKSDVCMVTLSQVATGHIPIILQMENTGKFWSMFILVYMTTKVRTTLQQIWYMRIKLHCLAILISFA